VTKINHGKAARCVHVHPQSQTLAVDLAFLLPTSIQPSMNSDIPNAPAQRKAASRARRKLRDGFAPHRLLGEDEVELGSGQLESPLVLICVAGD
jgi:hypothetical protein